MQAELVNGKGPFEVLSLAPLIASHIDLAPVEVGGGGVPRLPVGRVGFQTEGHLDKSNF